MNSRIKKTIGAVFIISSFVLWGVIGLLPFLGFKAGAIAGASAALVILGEIAFWLGLLLAGRDVWEKIKRFVWPTGK